MPERRPRGPVAGGPGPSGDGPGGQRPDGGSGGPGPSRGPTESGELRRLRGRIDALDRRIVRLLNERTELGREVGRVKRREGRRGVRDLEREREVLLRVAMENAGPLRQADLLAIYRRLVAATRAVEAADGATERDGARPGAKGPASPSTPDDGGR